MKNFQRSNNMGIVRVRYKAYNKNIMIKILDFSLLFFYGQTIIIILKLRVNICLHIIIIIIIIIVFRS